MRKRWIVISAALLAASAAAITQAAAATAAPSGHQQQGAVIVRTAPGPTGRILVTGAGQSLYVFTGDGFPFATTGPQLACTALNTAPNGTPCTTAWPPLLATGPLVGRGGVHQDGLGTVTRNGVQQVTYFGKPLYRFIADKAAGQRNGEDVAAFNGMWYLDHTDGRPAPPLPGLRVDSSRIGPILASPTASGARSLYQLSFDTPGMTTCTGVCAALWPPLLSPLHGSFGLFGFGTLVRPDGTFQVTFRGHPMYMFAFDLGAGTPSGLINGEYLIVPPDKGVWYTTHPNGTPNPGQTTVGSVMANGQQVLSVTGLFNNQVAVLYSFSTDTKTMSTCSGLCAKFWPPVLTTAPPLAGSGVNGAQLGTIRRSDGTLQVTYRGMPLYFFALGLTTATSGDGANVFGGTFHIVPAS